MGSEEYTQIPNGMLHFFYKMNMTIWVLYTTITLWNGDGKIYPDGRIAPYFKSDEANDLTWYSWHSTHYPNIGISTSY